MAPAYLSSLCQPVSSVHGRRHLRSADRGELQGLTTHASSVNRTVLRHKILIGREMPRDL